jgi:hypothetical protein
MAVWGLVVAVLLAVGSLPFFVGLAVVLPVLGHATWHLYRKVVEPDPNPPQEEPRPPMIAVKKNCRSLRPKEDPNDYGATVA